MVGFAMGGYVAREIVRPAPERVRVRAMGVRLGGEVFRRQSAIVRADDRERLHDIRCPTLIVAAGPDRLGSREESEQMHAGIPGSELAVIEDSATWCRSRRLGRCWQSSCPGSGR